MQGPEVLSLFQLTSSLMSRTMSTAGSCSFLPSALFAPFVPASWCRITLSCPEEMELEYFLLMSVNRAGFSIIATPCTISAQSVICPIRAAAVCSIFFFSFCILLLCQHSKCGPLLAWQLVAYSDFSPSSLGPSMSLSSAQARSPAWLLAGNIQSMHRMCWFLVQRSQASNLYSITELSVGDAARSKLVLQMLFAWKLQDPPST